MASIRVTCNHCAARVLLTPAQALLIPPSGADRFTCYLFFCPRDGHLTVAAADPDQVLLLLAAGVPADTPTPRPSPKPSPSPRVPDPVATAAPPLTRDDLLDFHRQLAGDDWLPQLTARTAGCPPPAEEQP